MSDPDSLAADARELSQEARARRRRAKIKARVNSATPEPPAMPCRYCGHESCICPPCPI